MSSEALAKEDAAKPPTRDQVGIPRRALGIQRALQVLLWLGKRQPA